MSELQKIKDICEKYNQCETCELWGKCPCGTVASLWNIEEIQKIIKADKYIRNNYGEIVGSYERKTK